MGYSKGKSIVGLDIEPGYVAAVETRPGQVKVERAATGPLPAGIVRDGEVVDVETLAASLSHCSTSTSSASASAWASPTSES